uniref:Uncharacterized protein n=2 Tax=Arion vulgaris TaxID=1028688 RepID=A0A0B7BNY1_9EUPU
MRLLIHVPKLQLARNVLEEISYAKTIRKPFKTVTDIAYVHVLQGLQAPGVKSKYKLNYVTTASLITGTTMLASMATVTYTSTVSQRVPVATIPDQHNSNHTLWRVDQGHFMSPDQDGGVVIS